MEELEWHKNQLSDGKVLECPEDLVSHSNDLNMEKIYQVGLKAKLFGPGSILHFKNLVSPMINGMRGTVLTKCSRMW